MSALTLLAAQMRFIAEDVVRARRLYFAALLGLIALLAVSAALRVREAAAGSLGVTSYLAALGIAAPFCRSWVDEDVRLGYAALWIQKPLTPLAFYSTRLLALVAWAALAALAAAAVTALPAFASGVWSPASALAHLLTAGCEPVLLVVLAFLGSALGARNAGLFAYGMLFGGLTLPSFSQALALGPAYEPLRVVFPPGEAMLDIGEALERGGLLAGLVQSRPVVLYTLVSAALSLALAGGVAKRLARAG
jgi:hypothetical protein